MVAGIALSNREYKSSGNLYFGLKILEQIRDKYDMPSYRIFWQAARMMKYVLLITNTMLIFIDE